MTLVKKLASLLNSECAENESNTPDWILASHLLACLSAYNEAVSKRDQWYGVKLAPGRAAVSADPPPDKLDVLNRLAASRGLTLVLDGVRPAAGSYVTPSELLERIASERVSADPPGGTTTLDKLAADVPHVARDVVRYLHLTTADDEMEDALRFALAGHVSRVASSPPPRIDGLRLNGHATDCDKMYRERDIGDTYWAIDDSKPCTCDAGSPPVAPARPTQDATPDAIRKRITTNPDDYALYMVGFNDGRQHEQAGQAIDATIARRAQAGDPRDTRALWMAVQTAIASAYLHGANEPPHATIGEIEAASDRVALDFVMKLQAAHPDAALAGSGDTEA